MNSPTFRRVIALLSGVITCLLFGATTDTSAKNSSSSVAQAGKAGVIIRLSEGDQHNADRREVILANPDVDCVMVSAKWPDLEPASGKFDFSKLKQDVADWSAQGKHVIIHLGLYGQSEDDRFTPKWLYDQKDVHAVSFAGGGIAKGAQVRIPDVWNPGFIEAHVAPLVQKLSEEFDGDARVWYIHPAFGHIGNLTAQPSRFGGESMQAVGWTPEKWKVYCEKTLDLYQKCFKKTPLLVTSSEKIIHDKKNGHFADLRNQLCEEFAARGVAMIYLGVDNKAQHLADLQHSAEKSAALAWQGKCRLGFGDDWPLWVQESRRNSSPTIGFDDAYFQTCVDGMLYDGKTKLPTTLFFLNPPEGLASSPSSPGNIRGKDHDCGYHKDFAAILHKARVQLLANDAKCFPRTSAK